MPNRNINVNSYVREMENEKRCTLIFSTEPSSSLLDISEKDLDLLLWVNGPESVYSFLKERSLITPECSFVEYLKYPYKYSLYLYMCSYLDVYKQSSDTLVITHGTPAPSACRKSIPWYQSSHKLTFNQNSSIEDCIRDTFQKEIDMAQHTFIHTYKFMQELGTLFKGSQ